MGPTIIETQRMNLRGWTDADVPALVALFDHADVSRFISNGRPITPGEAMTFVQRSQRLQSERGWCRWALEMKRAPGEIVGFCGVGCTFAPEAELGWTLQRDRWGLGLATEAARGALAYAFGVIGFAGLISAIDPANERSRRVAERLGMRIAGEIEHEGSSLLRYSIDNPLPVGAADPRYRRDCVGEAPGSSLTPPDEPEASDG